MAGPDTATAGGAAPAGLPPKLVEHLTAFLDGRGGPVPEPRDAATVVLLREAAAGGIEAFVIRRVRSMAFAPGMHVFPGGGVDLRDASLPSDAWVGPPVSWFASALSVSEGLALALVCAAVRETFEECGVLLAGADASSIVADVSGAEWEDARQDLIVRMRSLADMLAGADLRLRADLVRPWAHWITPEFEPRRFDTRFFVAALPAGQQTRDVGGESDIARWASPEALLAGYARGEVAMLPPTAVVLSELAVFATVDEVLAAAETRVVHPVLPRATRLPDGSVGLLLPGQAGYPA